MCWRNPPHWQGCRRQAARERILLRPGDGPRSDEARDHHRRHAQHRPTLCQKDTQGNLLHTSYTTAILTARSNTTGRSPASEFSIFPAHVLAVRPAAYKYLPKSHDVPIFMHSEAFTIPFFLPGVCSRLLFFCFMYHHQPNCIIGPSFLLDRAHTSLVSRTHHDITRVANSEQDDSLPFCACSIRTEILYFSTRAVSLSLG